MSALMSDGLNVGGRLVQKPVCQIRQCSGDCQLLADLRYVLISRMATG